MNKIKTAVIPIAGMGTRFLPITKAVSKEMLNILDRPLLDYAVDESIKAGIKKFIFIVNKENYNPLKYFSKNSKLESFLLKKKKYSLLEKIKRLNFKKQNVKLIFQNKPSGLADAILLAENSIKERAFCVILPDDLIIGANCTKQLIKIYEKKKTNILGVMEVDKKEVSKYGIIEPSFFSKNNYKIKSLVEKPNLKDAPSNLAIVGRYVLSKNIFEYIKKIKTGSGGELQLTDAISLSNNNHDTWGYKFKGTRYDCGNKLGFSKAQIAVSLQDKEIKRDLIKFIKKLGV